jgi:hypothetical protein
MVKKLKGAKNKEDSENKRKNRNKTIAVKTTLKNILTSHKSDINEKIHNEANYTEYITDIFNSRIINMLIVYFNKRKDKLKKFNYDIEQNFVNKFVHLVQELFLNEIEVAYLTLLIDKIGWKLDNFDHWIYFYTLGVHTKKMTVNDYISDDLLDIKDELRDKYGEIVNLNEFDDLDEKGPTLQEINARYKELSKPINSFCRKDFIIYSSIADKIVRLSQPYGEESNGNQIFIENKINDENKAIYEKENNNTMSIFSQTYQTFYPNMNTLSVDKNDIKKIIRNRNASIKAEISAYHPSAFQPNIQPDLNLLNIGGSQLSLINQRSDLSLNSDIHSSNNNNNFLN